MDICNRQSRLSMTAEKRQTIKLFSLYQLTLLYLKTLKADGQNSENSTLLTWPHQGCYHENSNLFMHQFGTYLGATSIQLIIITHFLLCFHAERVPSSNRFYIHIMGRQEIVKLTIDVSFWHCYNGSRKPALIESVICAFFFFCMALQEKKVIYYNTKHRLKIV